jgi:hypothetical protein
MKRPAAVLFVVLIALAGCSSRTQVHVLGPNELPPDLFARGRANEGPSRALRVTVFLVQDGRVVPVRRKGTSTRPLPELVARAVLAGPTQREKTNGIDSSLDEEIELFGVTEEDGVATLDLSPNFQTADQRVYLLRIAQLVYTLTELDGIDSVRFLLDGRQADSRGAPFIIDQNGRPQSAPVARAKYERFGPPGGSVGAPVSEGPLRIDIQGSEEDAIPR